MSITTWTPSLTAQSKRSFRYGAVFTDTAVKRAMEMAPRFAAFSVNPFILASMAGRLLPVRTSETTFGSVLSRLKAMEARPASMRSCERLLSRRMAFVTSPTLLPREDAFATKSTIFGCISGSPRPTRVTLYAWGNLSRTVSKTSSVMSSSFRARKERAQ